MPVVSVIIPAYNCANYICEAIDSVLRQTYQDVEIIVVDDGSTDDTKDVIAQYNGKIRYFYQNNSGASAARNLGIKEATGEYIAFLDGDDIWLPDKLQLQCEIMDANPDAAVITTDSETFDENGLIRTSFRPSNPDKLLFDKNSFQYKISQARFNDCSQFKGNFYRELLLRNFFSLSSTLVNKKCMDEIGLFNENLPINADYDLWIRIAKRHPILYLNKVTMKYRVRSNAASGKPHIRPYLYAKHDARLLEMHIKNCPNEFKDVVKKRIPRLYKVSAWGYLNNNYPKEARELCYRCLRYDKAQIKLYSYIVISFLPARLVRVVKKQRLSYAKS